MDRCRDGAIRVEDLLSEGGCGPGNRAEGGLVNRPVCRDRQMDWVCSPFPPLCVCDPGDLNSGLPMFRGSACFAHGAIVPALGPHFEECPVRKRY